MRTQLIQAAELAATIPCKRGHYLRWTSGEGAQVWIQIDERRNFIGATPFFQGKAIMIAALTKEVRKPDDTPLEGAVYAWAEPKNDKPERGAYPLVFDLVDKGLHETFDFPFVSPINLCAFTHEISVYDSEEEYNNSQGDGPKFALESFIPSGLFRAEGSSVEPPESTAIISGHVLETAELANSLTSGRYRWLHVKTYGGEIDVVAEINLICRPPTIGGIISGQFWLCGKILEPKYRHDRTLLKRIFR